MLQEIFWFHHTIEHEPFAHHLQREEVLHFHQTETNTMDDPNSKFAIHGTKIIDLSKIDVEQIRKEIKTCEYKAVEIDDLKEI